MDAARILAIRRDPRFAALTDEAFVTAMTTPQKVATRTELPRADFLYYLYGTGLYAKIVAAQMHQSPQVAGLAVTALAYLSSPDFKVIRWADPIMQACLTGFVAAGVFTAEEVETARVALTETWQAPIPGLTLEQLQAIHVIELDRAARKREWAAIYNAGVKVLDEAAAVPSLDDVFLAAKGQ
jgi:hypothetical protein